MEILWHENEHVQLVYCRVYTTNGVHYNVIYPRNDVVFKLLYLLYNIQDYEWIVRSCI